MEGNRDDEDRTGATSSKPGEEADEELPLLVTLLQQMQQHRTHGAGLLLPGFAQPHASAAARSLAIASAPPRLKDCETQTRDEDSFEGDTATAVLERKLGRVQDRYTMLAEREALVAQNGAEEPAVLPGGLTQSVLGEAAGEAGPADRQHERVSA